MSKKRTLDHFFQASPPSKKTQRAEAADDNHVSTTTVKTVETQLSSSFNGEGAKYSVPTFPQAPQLSSSSSLNPAFSLPSSSPPSVHGTYPFPIPLLPDALASALETSTPGHEGREMKDAPHLDVVYYAPFLERSAAGAVFRFLRRSLPYYRVKYAIRRGGSSVDVSTPRWTTVFGVDATAEWVEVPPSSSPPTSGPSLIDIKTRAPVPPSSYPTCRPRPVPACLEVLRRLAEVFTGARYNMVLVNYYADGADSISWHSDDERFLGAEPAIASLSLGATRDFLLRHKPLAADARADHSKAGISGNRGTFGKVKKKGATADSGGDGKPNATEEQNEPLTEEEIQVREAHRNPRKFPMAGGDMVLMRGETQSHWLHSVPKRSAKSAGGGEGGRINITFRRALTKAGTENYYQYNVGKGPVMKWDEKRKQMLQWMPEQVDATRND